MELPSTATNVPNNPIAPYTPAPNSNSTIAPYTPAPRTDLNQKNSQLEKSDNSQSNNLLQNQLQSLTSIALFNVGFFTFNYPLMAVSLSPMVGFATSLITKSPEKGLQITTEAVKSIEKNPINYLYPQNQILFRLANPYVYEYEKNPQNIKEISKQAYEAGFNELVNFITIPTAVFGGSGLIGRSVGFFVPKLGEGLGTVVGTTVGGALEGGIYAGAIDTAHQLSNIRVGYQQQFNPTELAQSVGFGSLVGSGLGFMSSAVDIGYIPSIRIGKVGQGEDKWIGLYTQRLVNKEGQTYLEANPVIGIAKVEGKWQLAGRNFEFPKFTPDLYNYVAGKESMSPIDVKLMYNSLTKLPSEVFVNPEIGISTSLKLARAMNTYKLIKPEDTIYNILGESSRLSPYRDTIYNYLMNNRKDINEIFGSVAMRTYGQTTNRELHDIDIVVKGDRNKAYNFLVGLQNVLKREHGLDTEIVQSERGFQLYDKAGNKLMEVFPNTGEAIPYFGSRYAGLGFRVRTPIRTSEGLQVMQIQEQAGRIYSQLVFPIEREGELMTGPKPWRIDKTIIDAYGLGKWYAGLTKNREIERSLEEWVSSLKPEYRKLLNNEYNIKFGIKFEEGSPSYMSVYVYSYPTSSILSGYSSSQISDRQISQSSISSSSISQTSVRPSAISSSSNTLGSSTSQSINNTNYPPSVSYIGSDYYPSYIYPPTYYYSSYSDYPYYSSSSIYYYYPSYIYTQYPYTPSWYTSPTMPISIVPPLGMSSLPGSSYRVKTTQKSELEFI